MGDQLRNVIDFAGRHGGVVTRSEALALGISARTLVRRVRDGVLIEIKEGVYALPGSNDLHVLDLTAACRKLGAVVSHQSAAYLHGMVGRRATKPTVSVLRNRSKDLAGVTVHQMGDLSEDQVVTIGGLRVTSPERTIIDLAATLADRALARILDNALASGIVAFETLMDLFERIGRRGKPGTAKLRKLLEARGYDYRPPESELERRLLQILTDADLPRPELQFRAPWLRRINGRVDMAYVDQRLVIEGDSRRWHQLSEAFETDRLRDNATQLAGWRILRFTWTEITTNPERVVTTVRRALELERN